MFWTIYCKNHFKVLEIRESYFNPGKSSKEKKIIKKDNRNEISSCDIFYLLMRTCYSLTAPTLSSNKPIDCLLKFRPHPDLEPQCETIITSHIHNNMVGSRISLTLLSCQVSERTGVGLLYTIQMTISLKNLKCYLTAHLWPSMVSRILVLQDVNFLVSGICECVMLHGKEELKFRWN